MADPIDDLLKPHLQKEAALKGQIASFQATIERLRLELVGVQQRVQGIREAADVLRQSAPVKRPRNKGQRNRGMSEHWQKIMQAVDLWSDEFTYADLTTAAEAVGQNPTNDTLRSQMSDYKGRGWVQSTGVGTFSLTDEGRRAAGIEILQNDKDKASDVGAPEAFGRVAELEDRPKTSEQHPFRKGENVGSSPTPPSSRPEPASFDTDFDDDVPF